ncbi:MAG TPA: hypothetical protein VKV23_04475 [Acidimicrobiales bacterium]|nr:hypothetical protein [Acidimicrobiales bacterium]
MARAHPVERRWFPTGAPQTLQIAAALLYWNAALGLILGIAGGGVAEVLLVVVDAAGAFGIANARRWGYYLALLGAVVPIVLLVAFGALLSSGILSLLFEVALVALLLHPQSRSYYKTWFR